MKPYNVSSENSAASDSARCTVYVTDSVWSGCRSHTAATAAASGSCATAEPRAEQRPVERPADDAQENACRQKMDAEVERMVAPHRLAAQGVVDREGEVEQRPAAHRHPAAGREEGGPKLPDRRFSVMQLSSSRTKGAEKELR
jgi:hypothetical protein